MFRIKIWRTESFSRLLVEKGVPKDHFTLVEGFYEESLPKFDWNKIKKASFVNMDCDYYSSTVTVLEAVKDKLDNFSIIYFDDLHSFAGNPHKGQTRAIREFNEKNKEMGISPCPLLSNHASGRLYWVWRETTH